MENCHCGWDGAGEHPCHGRAYTCRIKQAGVSLFKRTQKAAWARVFKKRKP